MMNIPGLVADIARKKDKAVRHKAEVEQRWIEDERQYWGFRVAEGDEDEAPPVDNKTQAKVDTIAARLGDMLFPTNDRNWSITNTPEPTDIDGNIIPPDMAREAVERAERKVDDYLNECQYNKHGRAAIFDACKLGIGVIKGPFAKSTTRRVVRRQFLPVMDQFGSPIVDPMTGQPAVQQSVQLDLVKEVKPASTRVDPWQFFPLPCRNMDECEGVFEMHLYPRAKLAKLADHPGFDPDAIREVIKADPVYTDTESSLMRERRNLLRETGEESGAYLLWEYHGPIPRDVLERAGIPMGDELDMHFGEVWFCGTTLLKAELNAILGDERVPYYVIPYKRDDADLLNSYGVCRIMRDDQRTIDIVYDAMQYNTRLTSGPQTITFEGRAVPGDGNMTINGPKHWRVTDPGVESVQQVIQFQNIPSVINQLIPMYEIAKQNADENTSLPIMAHGEAMNSVPTASGMAMIMNASNIVQRRFAHMYDDEITIPMLTRYYWWLMEFDEDDSIKVEMQIDPRGASYLLVKDMQAQHGMMALNLAQNDPELRQRMHMDRLYESVFNFLDVNTDDLWKSEEDLQLEGESPEAQMQMQAAQLALQEQEAKVRKAMAEAMKAEMEAMPQQQEGPSEKMLEIEARLLIAQMSRDARLAQISAEKDIKVTELMAKLQTTEQDRQFKEMMARLQAQQKAEEMARKDYQEGAKLALQARRKELREQRQELMAQNVARGYDTF